jgi:hypothetical protein
VQPIALEKLSQVDWLANCGQPLPIYAVPCIAVTSWSEASRLCADSTWEGVSENARGELTEYLSSRFPARYQGVWNKTARELRPKIESTITPKLLAVQQEKGFAEGVIDCIKWDVLHAMMTSVYIDCRPPAFYLQLFDIYESGHFPCGWSGSWPQGSLQVL